MQSSVLAKATIRKRVVHVTDNVVKYSNLHGLGYLGPSYLGFFDPSAMDACSWKVAVFIGDPSH